MSCPLCGAPAGEPWAWVRDMEYFTGPEEHTYHRCAACDVLYLAPMPVDRLAEIYPPNYYAFGGGAGGLLLAVKAWLDRRMFRRLLAAVPGERLAVLDVGGGEGWLLGQLRAADARVAHTCVVDLDARAEARALAQGHAFFRGPIEVFEADRPYDVVLLLNLIEHVADPRAVLARVRACLAPGGRVLVKTPNVDAWDARLFRHRHWGGYHCPRHWVLFTRASFTRVAAEAGLAVARFGYTQGAPFWATSVLAMLAARGWVDLSAERPAVYHPLFPWLSLAFAALDFTRAPFAPTSQMVCELVAAP